MLSAYTLAHREVEREVKRLGRPLGPDEIRAIARRRGLNGGTLLNRSGYRYSSLRRTWVPR